MSYLRLLSGIKKYSLVLITILSSSLAWSLTTEELLDQEHRVQINENSHIMTNLRSINPELVQLIQENVEIMHSEISEQFDLDRFYEGFLQDLIGDLRGENRKLAIASIVGLIRGNRAHKMASSGQDSISQFSVSERLLNHRFGTVDDVYPHTRLYDLVFHLHERYLDDEFDADLTGRTRSSLSSLKRLLWWLSRNLETVTVMYDLLALEIGAPIEEIDGGSERFARAYLSTNMIASQLKQIVDQYFATKRTCTDEELEEYSGISGDLLRSRVYAHQLPTGNDFSLRWSLDLDDFGDESSYDFSTLEELLVTGSNRRDRIEIDIYRRNLLELFEHHRSLCVQHYARSLDTLSLHTKRGNDQIEFSSIRGFKSHINTGRGNDVVKIWQNRPSRTSIDLGRGNDEAFIEQLTAGQFTLDAGPGNDFIEILDSFDSIPRSKKWKRKFKLGSGNNRFIGSNYSREGGYVIEAGSRGAHDQLYRLAEGAEVKIVGTGRVDLDTIGSKINCNGKEVAKIELQGSYYSGNGPSSRRYITGLGRVLRINTGASPANFSLSGARIKFNNGGLLKYVDDADSPYRPLFNSFSVDPSSRTMNGRRIKQSLVLPFEIDKSCFPKRFRSKVKTFKGKTFIHVDSKKTSTFRNRTTSGGSFYNENRWFSF